jgi:hypothetical protein
VTCCGTQHTNLMIDYTQSHISRNVAITASGSSAARRLPRAGLVRAGELGLDLGGRRAAHDAHHVSLQPPRVRLAPQRAQVGASHGVERRRLTVDPRRPPAP